MTSDAQAKAKASSAAAVTAHDGMFRQLQFYCLLATLLADLSASKAETLMHLTLWSWILHLLYFQLSLHHKNQFWIRLWHGPSLGGSVALWNMYLWTLYANPKMEYDLAPEGRPEWLILLRAFWLHLSPVLFHMVDLHHHAPSLRQVYSKNGSRSRFWQLWSAVGGYIAMGLIWEQVNGDATATYHVTVVSQETYVNVSKAVGIGSCLFVYLIFLKPLMKQ